MAAAVVVAAAAAARKDATGEGARGSACASARAPRIASCKAHVAKYKQLLRLQDHKDSSLFRKMLGNMSEKSREWVREWETSVTRLMRALPRADDCHECDELLSRLALLARFTSSSRHAYLPHSLSTISAPATPPLSHTHNHIHTHTHSGCEEHDLGGGGQSRHARRSGRWSGSGRRSGSGSGWHTSWLSPRQGPGYCSYCSCSSAAYCSCTSAPH